MRNTSSSLRGFARMEGGLLAANRAQQDRILKLGRSVQALHGWMEKEEAKRNERIIKQS